MRSHSVIVFSVRCHYGEKVHCMVSDSIFRHHASPVGYVGIVPECEYPSVGHF